MTDIKDTTLRGVNLLRNPWFRVIVCRTQHFSYSAENYPLEIPLCTQNAERNLRLDRDAVEALEDISQGLI